MYEQAIKDLQAADKIIKKRHRYFCGLTSDDVAQSLKDGRANFFFESPDGQNGELRYELIKLGWNSGHREAEYSWNVFKDGVHITYTEGDIYLTTKTK